MDKKQKKEVLKARSKMLTQFKEVGKSALNRDEDVKALIKDIKLHYKKETRPLSYSMYKSFLKYPDTVFNIILDLSGFTVKYNKKSFTLEIVKKREKKK